MTNQEADSFFHSNADHLIPLKWSLLFEEHLLEDIDDDLLDDMTDKVVEYILDLDGMEDVLIGRGLEIDEEINVVNRDAHIFIVFSDTMLEVLQEISTVRPPPPVTKISVDYDHRRIEIGQNRFTFDFFEMFNFDENEGKPFRFVRSDDGAIHIEQMVFDE